MEEPIFKYLEMIDSGTALSEEELSDLILGFSIEDKDVEESRWYMHMTSIVELDGRYFSIDWSRGLTEYQPNEYYDSVPIEVTPHKKIITTEVTEWRVLNDEQ